MLINYVTYKNFNKEMKNSKFSKEALDTLFVILSNDDDIFVLDKTRIENTFEELTEKQLLEKTKMPDLFDVLETYDVMRIVNSNKFLIKGL